MNWACIGFLATGLVFSAYANTFYSLAGKKLPVFLQSYAFAYYSLALAFLIWAFASLNQSFLVDSVIIGDVLLLVGSLFLLNIIFNKNKRIRSLSLASGIILSLALLWLRIYYFPPMPFMENSILVFNTPKTVSIALSLIFALIWLPANLTAAKIVASKIKIAGMEYAYSFIYVVSTVAAILFITFKTVPMVIASFVTLGVCFIMLLYSDYLIKKILSHSL